ncbi:MAG: 3-methyl-2-oxobutanoate hydroxymethyltransferase [Candidatus Omnitrophica bacterium]|nr:3-methyl-2-oxobutanoate hydroxymethyltransferase [Candidatus Omnitrophota bacterium]
MDGKKFTILDFKRKKEAGDKITMLTAYDCPMAELIDQAGVDAILVGDSVGMVLLGYESTARVTMEEMIHHSRAVRRGTRNAFLVGDMPFMSYQAGDEEAVRNAGRFVKEAGCDAVKLEGGREICPRVEAILSAGIPVLGHIGLTPQSVTRLGGYRVQGRDAESAARIMKDAVFLESAGCFAVVLECVPRELARRITGKLRIPTIGIGAGSHCDGQVLVTHDIIGYFDKFLPKFVKQYTNVGEKILEAVTRFKEETTSGAFPDDGHSFTS